MSFSLSNKSKEKLEGVDERLGKVIKRALEITPIDFAVIEGLRTPERQKELVSKGLSQTLKSKHLTGHAVDLGAIINGTITWDKPHYDELSKYVKQAAQELNIKIRWGGDFKSFYDGVHFELI